MRLIAVDCRNPVVPEVRLGADIHHHRLCHMKLSAAERPDFGHPYVARRAACQQYSQAYILFFLQPSRSLLQDIVRHLPDRSLASFAHKSWRLVLLGALKGLVEMVVLESLDTDCID